MRNDNKRALGAVITGVSLVVAGSAYLFAKTETSKKMTRSLADAAARAKKWGADTAHRVHERCVPAGEQGAAKVLANVSAHLTAAAEQVGQLATRVAKKSGNSE